MKRSTDRILTTHVGSLIRPQELQDFLRADRAASRYDQTAYEALPDGNPSPRGEAPGRGRRRRRQRRRVRQVDQLVAICAGAAVSGFERRPIKAGTPIRFKRGADRAASRSSTPSSTPREGVATTRESVCVGPINYTGQAELQRDIDNFKAALGGRQGRGGVPAGRRARQRHPGPQERVLQERRGVARRDRRGDAHRVPDDRRCRVPACSSTMRAPR